MTLSKCPQSVVASSVLILLRCQHYNLCPHCPRMLHTEKHKQPEQATGMHKHANAQTRLTCQHALEAFAHPNTAQAIEPFNVPTNPRRGCSRLDHPCRLVPLLHTLPALPTSPACQRSNTPLLGTNNGQAIRINPDHSSVGIPSCCCAASANQLVDP